MADQTYRKTLLLALAGTVVLSAAFYSYSQYVKAPLPGPDAPSPLHRSNAIRRPRSRRRWRRGYQPVPLDHDPTDRAIGHVEERDRSRRGYGEYQNKWFFPTPAHSQGMDLTLIPCNLNAIQGYLHNHSPAPLTSYQRDCLRLHVHGIFTQNFLKEEYLEGYMIGEDDGLILVQALDRLGVAPEIVREVVRAFDEGEFNLSEDWSPLDVSEDTRQALPVLNDGTVEARAMAPWNAIRALADPARQDDAESEISFSNHDEDPEGSQNMLDLLYHIAGEQARRDGYIHRGVECNSCGVHPIQGIRYHCANCFDFDLCEGCEASSAHIKSHVFYKIRIPAPSRGHIKQVTPKWYPGNPNAFLHTLPKSISKRLLEQTGMDRTEVDALYEQFKCLAGHYWPADPTGIMVAIDRKGFDAYFIPTTADKPSPANLIYDRIFAFYDVNHDGLIGFDEYIRGLARLQDKSRYARLKRIFDGYDLDSDGYVDRKDFLRMFRAYYALSKELSREVINAQDDFGYNEEELREVVQGSQPISAAFGGGTLYGHESRTGQDKQRHPNGDLVPAGGSNGVLQPDGDTRGDRARAIGNAALRDRSRNHPFRSFRTDPPEDEPLMLLPTGSSFMDSGMVDPEEVPEEELIGPDPPLQTYSWPPLLTPERQDIHEALGHDVSMEEITDPVDRSRVLFAQSQRLDAEGDRAEASTRAKAIEERWRRKEFYVDVEEGLTKPPGYTEPDSSDEDEPLPASKPLARGTAGSPRRPSMQSRSSSKVRFDDSAIDTDYETRSNASSRGGPVNERWGGYELGQAEADIGKDILYQAVQQGFNELLDVLFKDKEDDWLAATATRSDRHQFRQERIKFKESLEKGLSPLDEALEASAYRLPDDFDGDADVALSSESDTRQPEPAAPTAYAHDLDDHIGLMFGSDGVVNWEGPGLAGIEVEPTVSYRDPTLPQFRPDEEEPRSSAPDEGGRHHPFAGSLMSARETYYLWFRHDEIEAEAIRRGAPGKLSFSEFRRKMVPEDEVSKALGERAKTGDKDQEVWESSADLGKLAFVGTWLEMASF